MGYYKNDPVKELTAEEIAHIRATCREVHGVQDYWVDEFGENVYFVKSRRINAMGKEIKSRKMPVQKSGGYRGTTLIDYVSLNILLEHPGPTLDTYICISKKKRMKMSLIVALAWIGPKPFPEAQARHLDGNKNNYHYSNIAWGTTADNGLDTRWHNKVGRGTPESVRPECRKATA